MSTYADASKMFWYAGACRKDRFPKLVSEHRSVHGPVDSRILIKTDSFGMLLLLELTAIGYVLELVTDKKILGTWNSKTSFDSGSLSKTADAKDSFALYILNTEDTNGSVDKSIGNFRPRVRPDAMIPGEFYYFNRRESDGKKLTERCANVKTNLLRNYTELKNMIVAYVVGSN